MRFELILQPYRGCVINRVDHRGTFLELLTGIEPASSPLRGEFTAIGDSVAHISNYLPHLQDPQQQRSFSKTDRWLLFRVELCSHLVFITITHSQLCFNLISKSVERSVVIRKNSRVVRRTNNTSRKVTRLRNHTDDIRV